MNKVILLGNLVADPEIRTTQAGKAVANFRIAVRRNFKNANNEYESDFLTCKAFGTTADVIGKYFVKGSRILVDGSIQTSSWNKGDGTKGYSTDILVNAIDFIDRRGDAADTPPSNPYSSGKNPVKANDFAKAKQMEMTEVPEDDQLPF